MHTDLGDHIAFAKVNGVIHPLDKELQNGDVLEIIIDKSRKPSPFWLGFVKTIKAKNSIRAYLRKGDKDTHRERGKEMMNRYLEKSGLPVFDKDLQLLRVLDGKEYSMEERYQLLEQVGNFSSTPAALLKRILREQKIRFESQKPKQEDADYLPQEAKEKQEIII